MDLLANIKDLVDPIEIAAIKVKYEKVQNYIDNVSLVALQGENFKHATYKFTSTLRMLKYFLMANPSIKHSIYIKAFSCAGLVTADYEADGFGTLGEPQNFCYSEYVMFFLKENLNVNLSCINVGKIYDKYTDKFIVDLLCVLKGNSCIKRFTLKNKGQFRASTVAAIIKLLPKSAITKLMLCTHFNDGLALAINDFLTNYCTIKKFGIHDDYMLRCSKPFSLPPCTTIRELTLNCTIDHTLFTQIIKMLNENQITKLDLSNSRLDATFVQPLCEAIARNTKLTHLNLSSMDIDQICDITHLLTYNKFLQCVNLSFNPICECEHAYALIFPLLINTSIRTFKIRSFSFVDASRETLELLCNILKVNIKLKTFYANIANSCTDEVCMNAIVSALNGNRTMKKFSIMDEFEMLTVRNSTLAEIGATMSAIMKRNCLA